MDCRTHDTARRGRIRHGQGGHRDAGAGLSRPRHRPLSHPHRPSRRLGRIECPRSAVPTGPIPSDSTLPLVRAAELVTRVAVLIPMPSAALGRDDTAWSGFEELVSEASDLLAHHLGHDGRNTLCALIASPLSENPLCLLLMEQALNRIAADRP